MESIEPLAVLQIGIGTVVEQHANRLPPVEPDSIVQRRAAAAIGCIDLRARTDEPADEGLAVGKVQRRVAVLAAKFDAGPMFEKEKRA
jgi:hypothetical protein